MIPARYAILDALPKTDHNKVDRRILANMSFDRDLVQKTDRPRDSYEATLIRVWKKLLHVEEIGVRDNFFALGGHSLLVVRLFSQIEEHFQKTLPISTIFDHPTIEELAAHIQKTEASLSERLIIPDKPTGSRTPFFFLAGPNALSLARYLDAEQPLYSIQIHKVVGKYSRMEPLARACIQEMRTIQPEGPYFIGGFCLLSHLVLEIITQLKFSSAEIATVILVDAPSPINFQQSQSMRASLKRVWNALLKKSHSNKPAYLFQKIKDMMHGRWRRAIEFRLQKLTDSPPKGALGDGWEYYQQIARIYKPPKYTGNIHLILQRTAKVRFDLEWQRLASSVNVHWISKAPDHRSIFKEPYISEVASSITSLLENAGLEHSNEAHEHANTGFEGGITTTLNNG